jgi:hypothetical protein
MSLERAFHETRDLNRRPDSSKFFPVTTNYEKLIRDNLNRVFARLPQDLEQALPARRDGDLFHFRAFGEDCCLGPGGVTFSGIPETGPKALLISLYASHANHESMQLEPYRAFKDLPGSMPYHGAFSANSEQVLVSRVPEIAKRLETIADAFSGETSPEGTAGDYSFLLFPLPKIALIYIFYMPDDEFPASVSCLFSGNATAFMPLDGLADLGEYTSKRIIGLLQGDL